jgi:hypothetical protein
MAQRGTWFIVRTNGLMFLWHGLLVFCLMCFMAWETRHIICYVLCTQTDLNVICLICQIPNAVIVIVSYSYFTFLLEWQTTHGGLAASKLAPSLGLTPETRDAATSCRDLMQQASSVASL